MDLKETKTLLRRMALYYLLLAVNILPNASLIPDSFPTRNLSTIYLLLLSVCLVLYYAHRVSPTGGLSARMKALSWMALLLILLRGIKYSAVAELGVLARHTWYCYYIPMLLLSLLLFEIALLIPSGRARPAKRRVWARALTAALLVLVLTNDLHRQMFRFQPGFLGWDGDYSRGWLFYAVTAWQYGLYLAAVVILLIKCRVRSSQKAAWLLLIPLTTGGVMLGLLLTGRMPKLNGLHLVEFPETLIFTVAMVLEGCMQLGLIPTNTEYGALFRRVSIAAQITDRAGKTVYASDAAAPLTPAQFALEDGARIGEHTLLHRMELPGGWGFWQDDLTELDRLNAELAEAKEGLAQEAELIRLRSELKERQTKIAQRTLVYDTIARRTQRQSQAISRLAETGRSSADPARREACRRRITLLGAYIKRYANLMLLSQECSALELGELGLSVSEVLRYLNFCGTPGELVQRGDGAVSAEAALAVFEAFETLLEAHADVLRGVFVSLSAGDPATFKLSFENLTGQLPDGMAEALLRRGVRSECKCEDQVTYVCFTLPKGGEAA